MLLFSQTTEELCCHGEFAKASESLGASWRGVGVIPEREGRTDAEYANLLMMCGVLTINLGAIEQIHVQESAKDMLTRSAELAVGAQKVSARLWLGIAYIHCGEFNEAIALCDSVLADSPNSEVKFSAVLTQAIAEQRLGHLDKAETLLTSIVPLLSDMTPLLQGKFWLQRGCLARQSGDPERAMDAYYNASIHFQEAPSLRWEAAASNNLAGVYTDLDRFLEAHIAAERAITLWRRIGDKGFEARTWDQIAKIHLKEGNFGKAERDSRRSVELLAESENQYWLAQSLITHGSALSHLATEQARRQLERAAELCEQVGNLHMAREAYTELWKIVTHAKELAANSRGAVSPVEHLVIEKLLEHHDGKVSTVAKELGIRHQSLDKMISTRFPDLLQKRKQPQVRRKSLFRSEEN